jgi:hypothetical protein
MPMGDAIAAGSQVWTEYCVTSAAVMKSWWYYQSEVWLRPLKVLIALAMVGGTCWMVATVAIELQARLSGQSGADGPQRAAARGAGRPPAAARKPAPLPAQDPEDTEFDSKVRDEPPPRAQASSQATGYRASAKAQAVRSTPERDPFVSGQ